MVATPRHAKTLDWQRSHKRSSDGLTGAASQVRSRAQGRLFVLTQQPFHTCIETAFDFGFDVRREVVDHVLHDQLRGGTQFAVEVEQGIRALVHRAPLVAQQVSGAGTGGGSTAAGCVAYRVKQHRNLFLFAIVDRVGQQRRLQVVIAEQLADRFKIVQQVSWLCWGSGVSIGMLRVAVNGGLAEDSPVRGRNGNSPARPARIVGSSTTTSATRANLLAKAGTFRSRLTSKSWC